MRRKTIFLTTFNLVVIFLMINPININSKNSFDVLDISNNYLKIENENILPLNSEIGDDNILYGSWMNITGVEYEESTNSSQELSSFDTTKNSSGYIDNPPGWTAYELFAQVDDLYDNSSWESNGEITGQTPWIYDENFAGEEN